ncbi:phage holin family protein [Olleya aquimaris]|uniref:Putative membrane protein n=1 Tax=Olleya aquimaris TaxID=639310 RepID=A0A327RLS3_9FLAO|nr:phage holin family protein [Olleya aquimaris]RAJ14677.1 putative membrane protein [Olleya aquimaris]
MNLIIRLLLNAIAVFFLAEVLKGVHVDNYVTSIIVAIVLSILNLLVKPIIIILTLPITILTLGLFLFVINGLIILLADKFIDGFAVSSIWTAILFSILLSILQWLFQSFLKSDSKHK